jgi:hypothetical protein
MDKNGLDLGPVRIDLQPFLVTFDEIEDFLKVLQRKILPTLPFH